MATKPKVGQIQAQRSGWSDPLDGEFEGARFYDVASAAAPDAPVEAEAPGMLRGLADSGIALGTGAVTGVRLLTDVAGADNPVSQGLNDVTTGMQGYLSDYRQQEMRRRQQLIDAAQASGSTAEEVKAYLGGFAEAPVDTMLNAAGTSLPTIGAMAIPGVGQGRMAAMMAGSLGAAQGVGSVKSSIYQTVKDEALKAGMSPEQAEALAVQQQSYSESPGSIATGGALGVLAGTTGAEKLVRGLTRGAGKEASEGMLRRVATGAAAEAGPEALQGGQEQLAGNLGAQGAGFDVPTMRGVIGSAALEGVAGGGLGGALAIRKPDHLPERGPMTRAANAGIDSGSSTLEQPAPPEPPPQPSPVEAARLRQWANDRREELDRKAKGTKEQTVTGPDGEKQTIPAEQPQFLTPEEKQEREFLNESGGDAAALAQAYPGQADAPPVDPVAQRAADAPAEPTEQIRPDDILNVRGESFKSMRGAMGALRAAGEDQFEIVRVTDGLIVRRKEQANEPVTDASGTSELPVQPADGGGNQSGGSIGTVGRVAADTGRGSESPAEAPAPRSGEAAPVGDGTEQPSAVAPKFTSKPQPTTLGTKIDAAPGNAPGFTADNTLPKQQPNAEAPASTGGALRSVAPDTKKPPVASAPDVANPRTEAGTAEVSQQPEQKGPRERRAEAIAQANADRPPFTKTANGLKHTFTTNDGMDGQVFIANPGFRKGVKGYEVTFDKTGGAKDERGQSKFHPTTTVGKFRTEEAALKAAEQEVMRQRNAPPVAAVDTFAQPVEKGQENVQVDQTTDDQNQPIRPEPEGAQATADQAPEAAGSDAATTGADTAAGAADTQAAGVVRAQPKTLQERRIDAALERPIRENGEQMTRREWVRRKVAEGLKTSVTQEDRIKPMSRMQYFRANNEEQRAHEKKIKEAGKKDVYWIGDYEVTKIEHDYANSLQSEPTAKTQEPPASTPVAESPSPRPEPGDGAVASAQDAGGPDQSAPKRAPKSFRKTHMVDTPVFDEESGTFKPQSVDAETALKALKDDLDALKSFRKCITGG